MKLAAIDIGTNAIRTVITEVHTDGTFEIVDQLRDIVRLGEGETLNGLTPRAMVEGLQALARSKALCNAHHVDQILAVATSAVREAKNGSEFIERVKQQTDIAVKLITVEEESRLIYLGARETLHLGERRALFIDIGGGSDEFIIGDRRGLQYMASVKLGVLRLLDRFPISDPINAKEIRAATDYIDEKLCETVAHVRAFGFDCVVATSGTSLTLFDLALDQHREKGPLRTSLNNQVVSAEKIKAVCKWLLKSDRAQRRRTDQIHPARLDSIVMGAALWQYLLSQLRVNEVIACESALREGLVIDYLQTHLSPQPSDQIPDTRRRSVLALARRSSWDEAHSQHVAALALSLFDQLQKVHQQDANARTLLEYASLLHDIGYHINAKSHHKHGAYLILHADLLGFTQQDIQMLAAVVQYHRKRKPAKGDPALTGLNAAQRYTIGLLAGILRVADALDRTHSKIIPRVAAIIRPRSIEVRLFVEGDAHLEIAMARENASLFEDMCGRRMRFLIFSAGSTLRAFLKTQQRRLPRRRSAGHGSRARYF